MRARAQAAGTLQSNSQITLTTSSPGVILIQPANPQFVYVPQYNPAIVYGAPIVVPMYTPAVVFATPALILGVGVSFGGGGMGRRRRLRLGLSCLGLQLGRLGRWWQHDHLQPQHLHHQQHMEQPQLQRISPLGPWQFRLSSGHWQAHYGPNGAYDPNGYFGPNGGWHPDAGPDSHTYNPTTNPNGYHPGEDTHYGPKLRITRPDTMARTALTITTFRAQRSSRYAQWR